jgi:hypothetical protein
MSFYNELPRNNPTASSPLCTVESVFDNTFGDEEYEFSRGTICDIFPAESHMLWNGNAMLMRWKLTQEFDFVRELAIVLPVIPGVCPGESVLNIRLAVDEDMADFMYRKPHVDCANKCENRGVELFKEIDGDVALVPLPLGLSWIPMALLGESDVRVLVEIPSAYRSVRDRIRLVGVRYKILEESRAKLAPMIGTRYEFLMSSSRMKPETISMIPVGGNFRGDIPLYYADPVYCIFVLGVDAANIVNVKLAVNTKAPGRVGNEVAGDRGKDFGATISSEVMWDRHGGIHDGNKVKGGVYIPVDALQTCIRDNRGCDAAALTLSENERISLTVVSRENIHKVELYTFYYKQISISGGVGSVKCSM